MINVSHVSKIYNLGKVQVSALSDVSLRIEDKEMLCIMGKSGSGKSTLLRQLSLVDRPSEGDITIDDTEVTKIGESKRANMRLQKLGYVFQEYALIPELTAQENVFLPAMMLGARRADYLRRSKEILELVDLGDRLWHLPKELSGGQQQRVAIARALVNNPSIIYADEPTANLDSISAKTVMDTLQRLNTELGVTIIFVSHDPDDYRYASRLVYLSDGKIVEGEGR
jgi:putative ABC transport system ATP-binding protein